MINIEVPNTLSPKFLRILESNEKLVDNIFDILRSNTDNNQQRDNGLPTQINLNFAFCDVKIEDQDEECAGHEKASDAGEDTESCDYINKIFDLKYQLSRNDELIARLHRQLDDLRQNTLNPGKVEVADKDLFNSVALTKYVDKNILIYDIKNRKARLHPNVSKEFIRTIKKEKNDNLMFFIL